MKRRKTVWAWAEVNACHVPRVQGCVRHDPGVTNLFVAAEWILYHFNCSPLWALLSIVLAYALLRCSPPGYQRWTRARASAGDRHSDPLWHCAILWHFVTLCDTVTLWLEECYAAPGGHWSPGPGTGGSSGVRAATSHCSHNPTLALGHFIILLHCQDPSE